VSVGADLEEARRRAGLTVAQVSERTRIRTAIISDIEHDDYCACGGDFYARGHIRAIAKAVGTDPGPLIGEYDAAHHAPAPAAAELFEPVLPVRPDGPQQPGRRRHRMAWAVAVVALVAAAGVVAYLLIPGPNHSPHTPAGVAAGLHRAAHHHAHHAAPPVATAASRYAHRVAIHLAATEACWVEFTTPGGAYLSQFYVLGGTSKRWAFGHAVDMTLGNPGGVRLTVDGKNALPPGPSPAVTLHIGLHGKISR
jgi:Helix-turn-helix domain/Domain of unknown function (DUF4115)